MTHKSTRIIGTILFCVLIGCCIAGTATAADDVNLGTVYVYKLYDNTTAPFSIASISDFPLAGSIWTTGLGTEISFIQDTGTNKCCIVGEGLEEDVYFCAVNGITHKFTLRYPTAPVNGFIYDSGNAISPLIGFSVDTDKTLGFTIPTGANGLMFTNPQKNLSSQSLVDFGAVKTHDNYTIKGLDTGEWTVQAVFDKDGTNYTRLAPGTAILGKEYHFTVILADTGKRLTVSSNEVTQGGFVTVTLSAPYQTRPYLIMVENGKVPANQSGISDARYVDSTQTGSANVTITSAGKTVFTVQSTTLSDMSIKLMNNGAEDKSVTVIVNPGIITAKAKKNAYYLGDKIKLSGTNELGGTTYFFVKGANFAFRYTGNHESGKEWETSIKSSKFIDGKIVPDAGSYAIYAASLKDGISPNALTQADLDDPEKCSTYTIVSVDLLHQYISLSSIQDNVISGSEFKITGKAEGTLSKVQYYIFGTNFFASDFATVSDGKFTVKLTNEDTFAMNAGQYFIVIQHPMYDDNFNIGAERDAGNNLTGNILLNKTSDVKRGGDTIFNANSRQSSNAAMALCDALDSEDIDDMYVKASFFVVNKDSVINPLPSTITKGEILTISGTATGYKNKMVTAELLSTAFTAASKRDAETNSFISASTMIGDDGTWEIKIDTSTLNIDSYTASISVADLSPVVSIMEITAAPDQKTGETKTPVPTVKPTALPTQATGTTKSPGFSICAIIGVGLAAVFLRNGGKKE